MIFDSPTFLFLFLPVVLGMFFLAPGRFRHLLLLAASVFFYAWGDGRSVYLLFFTILFNYGFGLLTAKKRARRSGMASLAAAVTLNAVILLFYKYLRFAAVNLLALGISPTVDIVRFLPEHLPPGISFLTFSAIAYQVDIYRGKTGPEQNLIAFGLYLAHFAKVLAGPIVRYADVARELRTGTVTLEDFSEGIRRFVIGMGKKVLIANRVGVFADATFQNPAGLDTATAWTGILCYTVQIYCDFSGYSDMAIGIGRMLGFRFTENFNYPYISQSIQEFWRRWHISLSTWFRDYLYIPLGGNRVSRARLYCNLAAVFLLCGLWHGASWNFIAWGAWYGIFLILERAGLARVLQKTWPPLRHIYVLLVVAAGWVFFRAANLTQAMQYFRTMFSFSTGAFDYFSMTYLNRQLLLVLCAGIIGSTPVSTFLRHLAERPRTGIRSRIFHMPQQVYPILTAALIAIVFAISVMQLAVSTFTPFIYARF